MKGPTFERLVSVYMKVAAVEMRELFVNGISQIYSMEHLKERKSTFRHFPNAIEAIDVTFQQANKPSGKMVEGKKYFSGKHKLDGYKVEVAVRPNGMAAAFSKHYAGSVSDIAIMTKRIEQHKFRLEKVGEDKYFIDDEYESSKSFESPKHWAVLCDKGYQGANEMLRCITPHKKPPNGTLTREQDSFNKDNSTDRILVENYFGSMQSLWGIMAQKKYQWNESFYDTFVSLCVAFTNSHVEYFPLRTADGQWYNRYLNKLSLIGREAKRNSPSLRQCTVRSETASALGVSCCA